MKLLLGKEVEHIIINDIDRSIYSIWKLILSDNDELASFIQSVPLTIDEWRKQKEIVTHQTDYDDCELGLASFFMNRTNVSGIISGGDLSAVLARTANTKSMPASTGMDYLERLTR